MYIAFFRNSILFGFPRHFSARTRNLVLFHVSIVQLARQRNGISKKCYYISRYMFLLLFKKSCCSLALLQCEKSVPSSLKKWF